MTSLQTTPVPTTSRQRTKVREVLGLRTTTTIPVRVIPGGALAPRLVGRRGGHYTRGGSRVYHPSAYSRKGWSNLVYRTSTRRIYVGERWIAEHAE